MPQGSPTIGQPAPDFTLPDENGRSVKLSDYRGKSPVVLYFYPKADTPGCTKEACGFRDAIASYKDLGVPVFGVSPDPVADVKAFSDKFRLNFPLLADADHKVTDAYGCWVEKEREGVKSMGAARTTFIVNRDGKVAHVFEKVNAEGHDQEVLAWLRANRG
jgi:peroxiredoxin Q/BCP